MEKEQWKEDILRSLEGMQRAEPDAAVYANIRASIRKSAAAGALQVVHRPYVALAAACLLVLVTVNLYALQQRYAQPSNPAPAALESLDNARFDLYQ